MCGHIQNRDRLSDQIFKEILIKLLKSLEILKSLSKPKDFEISYMIFLVADPSYSV